MNMWWVAYGTEAGALVEAEDFVGAMLAAWGISPGWSLIVQIPGPRPGCYDKWAGRVLSVAEIAEMDRDVLAEEGLVCECCGEDIYVS